MPDLRARWIVAITSVAIEAAVFGVVWWMSSARVAAAVLVAMWVGEVIGWLGAHYSR